MRYIDRQSEPMGIYSFNPNGSLHGLTEFTNNDGHFKIMMPHPERRDCLGFHFNTRYQDINTLLAATQKADIKIQIQGGV
jgi:phosphoribosylformylglycinamidine (FGAM) synthase-like amidotransferase family enzyme